MGGGEVSGVGRPPSGRSFRFVFNLKMSMFFKGVSRIHESGSFRFVFNLIELCFKGALVCIVGQIHTSQIC